MLWNTKVHVIFTLVYMILGASAHLIGSSFRLDMAIVGMLVGRVLGFVVSLDILQSEKEQYDE